METNYYANLKNYKPGTKVRIYNKTIFLHNFKKLCVTETSEIVYTNGESLYAISIDSPFIGQIVTLKSRCHDGYYIEESQNLMVAEWMIEREISN